MTPQSIENLLPKKKEVPEHTDTTDWDNHGDIEEANAERYENMSYNAAREDCLNALLKAEIGVVPSETAIDVLCIEWILEQKTNVELAKSIRKLMLAGGE